MLAQEVVRSYADRARFVVEDFGASPLAERFGVDKYPAVFVDGALVARPEDFYAWGGPATGKYLPWSDLSSRRRFQADLRRMLDIRLGGGRVPSLPGGSSGPAPALKTLPPLTLTDLAGKRFDLASLRGKPLLVEFWAPWCPPCLATMEWMKKLDPAKVGVVAIAIESERPAVDAAVAKFRPPGRIVMGSSDIAGAFGGIPAVPLLFLARGDGSIARVFYGAPPNLHEEIEAELAKLR